MDIIHSRNDMQAWSDALRSGGRSLALVPTMGAIHPGHLNLVRIGRQVAHCVAASVFVNPAQFAAGEDFDAYPRCFSDDIDALERAGCACVYCPDTEQMYRPGSLSHVRVDQISATLEGRFRPHFFHGVTDAVCRLFIHTRPSHAVFGEKDYQQLVIVRRMTADLGFDTEILASPTIRLASGLAVSSRNAYLSSSELKQAANLYAALERAAKRINNTHALARTLQTAKEDILAGGFDSVDYIAACCADTLTPLTSSTLKPRAHARLLAAATIGTTRLIDNVAL